MLTYYLKRSLWDWAVANIPRAVTFDAGDITGGYIEVNVNGTVVNQPFDTDKETTITALAAAILDQVDDVCQSELYYDLNRIKIVSCNNVSLTIVINNQFLGDIIFGVENSVTVIWMNENGPRPELPYISLNILSLENMGDHADNYPVSDAGILEGYQIVEFVLSIQAYGTESFQLLKDLNQSLDRFSVHNDLNSSDHVVFFDDFGGVRDISAIIGTHEEKRAILELRGRTFDQFQDKVGAIETIEAVQTSKSDQSDIVSNISIP